jgi:transcriptional regulator with XRE-family HTH domain
MVHEPTDVPLWTGVGARIRQQRMELGLTQQELAHRTGVSKSMISQIENGRSYPSISTLYLIGSTLDACFDELMSGKPADHVTNRHDSNDRSGKKGGIAAQGKGREIIMQGVFHTGITVSDLDRSLAFYRDVLRLEVWIEPTEVFGGDELSRGVGVDGASLRLAVMKVGASSLELLEYATPPPPNDKAMPPHGLGSMHVAFQVDDVSAKMSELESRGVEFLSPPNIVDEGPLAGWRWVYFNDPDGVTLELVEFNPPGD